MKTKVTNLITWILATVLLVWADQYTKQLAVIHLKDQEPFVIWKGVFELLYSENRGAAFGILQGRQGFFFIVAFIVFIAAIYIMWRMPALGNRRYLWLRICIILITSGAAGNMVDRMTLGYVVDFLYFSLINFPIFNVADIYVTVATAILLLLVSFYYKEEDFDCFQWRKKDREEVRD